MKKYFFLIYIFTLSVRLMAQGNFQPGQYIDIDGVTHSGFIDNRGWRSNPESFDFKSNETSTLEILTLDQALEVEIFGYGKFVRKELTIDLSSTDYNKLSDSATPQYEIRTIFLRVLIEGSLTLLEYSEGNNQALFIESPSKRTTQLLFRMYRIGLTTLMTDYTFRTQLSELLNCSFTDQSEINTLEYKSRHIKKIIIEYNKCINSEYKVYQYKTVTDSFNFSIRPTFKLASLTITNNNTSNIRIERKVESLNNTGFKFETALELVLPFNHGSWALAVEPGFQYLKKNISNDFGSNYKLIYKSIEFPFGIRRKFLLKNESEIYFNVFSVYDFALRSSLTFEREGRFFTYEYKVRSTPNLFLGVGYKLQNGISVDFKYSTKRNLVANAATLNVGYDYFSIGVGYQLF